MASDQQLTSSADFAMLREQGIKHLEKLAGSGWSDFNTHDPGITILEQLCYALTDLSYRTQYELPDLLSRDGEGAYESIYTPAQILPTNAVTLADLRKLVIDVTGVKNAWIDIVDEPSANFDVAKREVSGFVSSDSRPGVLSPNISEIRVKGLLRVRIEKSDVIDIDASAIRREAAQRLHQCRGLGQDFEVIEVLEQQPVRLMVALEIDAVEDAGGMLASVYQRIEAYMSPSVPFHTFEEMQQRGWRIDEIFEGPLLDHGFIDSDELAQIERRTSLRISDLIRELMTVPGVAAVKNLRFLESDGKLAEDWLLSIDADMTPRFDLLNSIIHLEKRGMRVDKSIEVAAQKLFRDRRKKSTNPVPINAAERDLHLQPGRDRNVANYFSVQQQFPMVYGIGAAGLPQSASPERKVQAKQLKAYMMFYDQLLANQFAQLANVGKLFSFHDETPDSYFSQAVQDDGSLGLDAVRRSSSIEHLQQLTEEPLLTSDKPGASRRNRFLDHLLARFGEQFRDYALLQPGANSGANSKDGMTPEEQLARNKRAFLRDYPRIGRDRGVAFNYLEPSATGSSSFLPGDFIDSASLAGKLIRPSADRLAEYLWTQIQPDEQSELINLDLMGEGSEAALITAFNQIIHNSASLYTTDRFADVELSSQAERLVQRDPAPVGDDLIRLNRLLLEDAYPDEITRSYSESNISGLELTLRRKLGVTEEDEPFHLVEHILMRPIDGDQHQQAPLFRHAQMRDPYSLQISLVFPDWPACYQNREFVEQTVREETPAHLTVNFVWKDAPAMQIFKSAYSVWQRQWRSQRRTELGLRL
jgi:hypothetical protein